MTQLEVIDALKDLRRINDKWYTSTQIIEFMKDNKRLNGSGKTIYDDLLRLSMFGLIEIRGVGLWNHHKEFRGKLH